MNFDKIRNQVQKEMDEVEQQQERSRAAVGELRSVLKKEEENVRNL